MFTLFLSRLLSALTVMLGVVTLVFLLIHLVPGDPVQVILGESATTTDQEALRHALGLDQPLLMQWWLYVTGLLHGDLGTSLTAKEPVSQLLWQRLPVTALLAVSGLSVAILLAFPLGGLAALYPHRAIDHGAMIFALLGVSIPNFLAGPVLILFFSLTLGWLPVSGLEGASSLVLPALTMGTALAAILARMVRATLLEVLHEDYIRTAKAKGLNQYQILVKHALRNASLPLLTILGLQLGALLGGAVITETIFALPGIGLLTIEAIQQRDYPVVQACVLLISLTYVMVNMATDMLYTWLDPRVRYRAI
ncbi:ABC-type dipeptide/oligopeptide/nickel transport system, permease component [Beggiatoa alba B18LD]|uniref:ABC-type dipeptide/oligopeptide/nickel transport system, permease component n=1 Tax=Beggiatoa alba B18LD TaxID=395493 RepID=I3CI65_9GAMM|nr:nickel ABC transporter permease [Beggiatoa alba]EIJ43308.1 ABC-type dipeptide/oligopeptide/nickel transport system, permease component [Beggiatoa alba B18LD]